MHEKETQTPTTCTYAPTWSQRHNTHVKSDTWHRAEINLLRGSRGRRGKYVPMFCRCPTTERRITIPRKREAKSERKRGVARMSERRTDRK